MLVSLHPEGLAVKLACVVDGAPANLDLPALWDVASQDKVWAEAVSRACGALGCVELCGLRAVYDVESQLAALHVPPVIPGPRTHSRLPPPHRSSPPGTGISSRPSSSSPRLQLCLNFACTGTLSHEAVPVVVRCNSSAELTVC
jgi:hypothetical protein